MRIPARCTRLLLWLSSPDAARRAVPAGLSLLLLCATVYLPGFFTIPVIDRDEARFAQASRQMAESLLLAPEQRSGPPAHHAGGALIPMIQDRPRLNKPPLIYWLQTASVAVFSRADPRRDAIWMYRIPSALAATLTVFLTWRLGLRMTDARAAWLAGALVAVCPLVAVDAHQARADQTLVCATIAAVAALWEVRRRGTDAGVRTQASLWFFIALGVLAKGPITPMIVALAALAVSLVERDFSWLKRLRVGAGTMGVLLVVGAWAAAVADRVGWSEYARVVWDETIGRSAGAKEGHWGPPGYHLVLLAALFFPGSLFTLGAITRGVVACVRTRATMGRAQLRAADDERAGASAGARARGESALRRGVPDGRIGRFLVCVIVPGWVVFEVVSTKLPHYTMPLYPAIAILSAREAVRVSGRIAASRRRSSASRSADGGRTNILRKERVGLAQVLPWGMIGLALCAAPAVLTWFGGAFSGVTLLGMPGISVGLMAAMGLSVWNVRRGRVARGMIGAIVCSAGVAVGVFGVAMPGLAVWNSWRCMEIVRRADPRLQGEIASVGYAEDSLVFETRGRVRVLEAGEVGAWLEERAAAGFGEGARRILIVNERAPEVMGAENEGHARRRKPLLGVIEERAETLGVVEGFNYSNGRRVRLRVCGANVSGGGGEVGGTR